IILKYRSFAGQTNPARLRMTKMWGLHSNDKKREKCFFTQSDVPFCHTSPFVTNLVLIAFDLPSVCCSPWSHKPG
ncbi:MAG: hypothetical protein ACOCG5_06930, partial [Candidatus Alkaliphilus sp. MAG34]